MPAPARFDDTLVAGDTFTLQATLNGVNVLGGSATLHIRSSTTADPVIVCNGLLSGNGKIIFKIPPSATRKLDSARDGYNLFVYNAQYTSPDGDVSTFLAGTLRVLKDMAV